MAAKTKKDSMAWLKLNVGLFSTETSGLSDTHVAIYIKLLLIYWSTGNHLPEIDSKMHRRLGVVDNAGHVALADILNEFFPLDENGDYSHTELDRQLNEIKEYSKEQSDRAKRPRGGNKALTPKNEKDDDTQF